MLNDRRLDFKPPTTRGRTFPTRPTPILSARKPRESEDRQSVDVEHLEVLGRAEIPDLVSATGGLRGASPASSQPNVADPHVTNVSCGSSPTVVLRRR